MFAMSKRDSGVGGNGRSGCDAGYDLEGNSVVHQIFSFLASAAEYKWISPLKTSDNLAFIRPLYDERVDVVLGQSVFAALLPDINQFSILPTLIQQPFVREIIINNDIGLFYAFQAFDCNQTRIAGARTD